MRELHILGLRLSRNLRRKHEVILLLYAVDQADLRL